MADFDFESAPDGGVGVSECAAPADSESAPGGGGGGSESAAPADSKSAPHELIDLVEVVACESRGFKAVATRDLAAHELILSEAPIDFPMPYMQDRSFLLRPEVMAQLEIVNHCIAVYGHLELEARYPR